MFPPSLSILKIEVNMSESVATTDPTPRAAAFAISKQMLSQVSPAVQTQLHKRSDLSGLVQAITHLSLVVAFGALSCWNGYLASWPGAVAFLCQAFCMAFLFNGLHETVHMTAFKSPWLNVVFGNIFGFLIFRPMKYYRCYHFNHHKFTGDSERDPELQNSMLDMSLDNIGSYLTYLSGLPFWIDRFTSLIRHSVFSHTSKLEDEYLTPLTRRLMLSEARIYVSLYATLAIIVAFDVAGMSDVVLWGWFLPTLAAQPFLRFYLLAEHHGCPQGVNMLSNTRTTKTWWWYRQLAWNMPYHGEHHAFPSVPFHQLPALYEHLKSQTEHRLCNPSGENGYLGVHATIIKRFLGA